MYVQLFFLAVIVGEAEPLGGDSEIIVATTSSSDLSQTELQNLQLSG